MIRHASTEDTRVSGGSVGMIPQKNFELLRTSTVWKYIEIVNSTVTTLFCILLNLLRSHQQSCFGSWGWGWGWGGGGVCLRACLAGNVHVFLFRLEQNCETSISCTLMHMLYVTKRKVIDYSTIFCFQYSSQKYIRENVLL